MTKELTKEEIKNLMFQDGDATKHRLLLDIEDFHKLLDERGMESTSPAYRRAEKLYMENITEGLVALQDHMRKQMQQLNENNRARRQAEKEQDEERKRGRTPKFSVEEVQQAVRAIRVNSIESDKPATVREVRDHLGGGSLTYLAPIVREENAEWEKYHGGCDDPIDPNDRDVLADEAFAEGMAERDYQQRESSGHWD